MNILRNVQLIRPSNLWTTTTIQRALLSNIVNLSYDLNDKFNSQSALVISHGLFASKASWKSLAKRLNQVTKQKIYTVDMRNHGDSEPYVDDAMTYDAMADDLEEFINKIVIKKDKCQHVSLLGHSMGGKASMTLCLRDTERAHKLIDRLIVADIAPSVSPSLNNIKAYINKMESIDMSAYDSLDVFRARKQIDAKLCELEKLRQEEHQRQFLLTRVVKKDGKIKWHFNLKAIKSNVESIMKFKEYSIPFRNPTLFIGGELSEYISEADMPIIKRYFPNHTLVKIPKAGHVVHFDNPSDTIKEIDKFIN